MSNWKEDEPGTWRRSDRGGFVRRVHVREFDGAELLYEGEAFAVYDGDGKPYGHHRTLANAKRHASQPW